MIQAYIRLKLLTGLRKMDLLTMKETMLTEAGIDITPRKTAKSSGKRTIYQWSDELRTAVAMAKAARPVDISPYLFCDKFGRCYVNADGKSEGWSSVWGRFMERLITETKVTERFRGEDLRAKVASEAENLEHARALLSHADSKITNRVYRRKPETVRPVR